ncbi:hypothetical protein HD554DRAFT_2040155 [Boletus coccyginus]|nr:hypothetical protein HD554DRAFT_2040155 [Boletus coccyginus]
MHTSESADHFVVAKIHGAVSEQPTPLIKGGHKCKWIQGARCRLVREPERKPMFTTRRCTPPSKHTAIAVSPPVSVNVQQMVILKNMDISQSTRLATENQQGKQVETIARQFGGDSLFRDTKRGSLSHSRSGLLQDDKNTTVIPAASSEQCSEVAKHIQITLDGEEMHTPLSNTLYKSVKLFYKSDVEEDHEHLDRNINGDEQSEHMQVEAEIQLSHKHSPA